MRHRRDMTEILLNASLSIGYVSKQPNNQTTDRPIDRSINQSNKQAISFHPFTIRNILNFFVLKILSHDTNNTPFVLAFVK